MAAVAADRQVRSYFELAVVGPGDDAVDAVAVAPEIDDLGPAHDLEIGKPPPLLAQEVEKIPLGHQRDERRPDCEPREIRDAKGPVSELAGEPLNPLMRTLKERIEKAEFIHHLHGRRMDRVAAEVPQEIGVLLQHQRVDSGAPQQVAQHHARRTSADHAALRFDPGSHRSPSGRNRHRKPKRATARCNRQCPPQRASGCCAAFRPPQILARRDGPRHRSWLPFFRGHRIAPPATIPFCGIQCRCLACAPGTPRTPVSVPAQLSGPQWTSIACTC